MIRTERVGLATAIATLRGSPNASRERLDEVSRVRLPESADPTVYGIDRCSLASELSTDIVGCQAFYAATIFLQIAYSLESGRARVQVRAHIPPWIVSALPDGRV